MCPCCSSFPWHCPHHCGALALALCLGGREAGKRFSLQNAQSHCFRPLFARIVRCSNVICVFSFVLMHHPTNTAALEAPPPFRVNTPERNGEFPAHLLSFAAVDNASAGKHAYTRTRELVVIIFHHKAPPSKSLLSYGWSHPSLLRFHCLSPFSPFSTLSNSITLLSPPPLFPGHRSSSFVSSPSLFPFPLRSLPLPPVPSPFLPFPSPPPSSLLHAPP